MKKQLRILTDCPELNVVADDVVARMTRYEDRRAQLLRGEQTLVDFAGGHLYFGLHRTPDGWVYREWAPHAEGLSLIGDFNAWDREAHPLHPIGDGNWEVVIDGVDAIHHLDRYKVFVRHDGTGEDHIPLYAAYVVQDPRNNGFDAVVWAPETTFSWSDDAFLPASNVPPFIYESHVGMATEEYRVGTYREFAELVLPRVKKAGYNTIQLMAIMEHPYYGSFGYQVSNFFAASSRCGTPDDLKYLVDTAHSMGISVLLDVVHSHAVKNTREGINMFDGTVWQFFHEGAKGDHPAWGSKVFDYGRTGVLHFLLSNLRFWMEEYHFDGFRFDGVTSMLYHDHGLGVNFGDMHQYFSMNTDVDAVTYLMLATELIHAYKPGAVCIAEDMSAMPGMCRTIEDGGMGFDYRLSMGLPDYFIKTIKEKRDGDWDMGRMFWELQARRPGEKNVAYAESHDQALVGDKTIMFRLADKEMYDHMRKDQPSIIIDRAMALHKMIRLVVIGAGGEGYLNFMGNEFGHPEWIDFPREGNGWGYQHARRQWSLVDNDELRFGQLNAFDHDMVWLIRREQVLGAAVMCQVCREDDQLLAYERGTLTFAFNFHPEKSQPSLFIPAAKGAAYQVVLSSDDETYGGQGRISKTVTYVADKQDEGGRYGVQIYLPARTALVLKRL